MSPEYETLSHPRIGLIRGIKKFPNVNQYLGVQYATLEDRFARGQIRQKYGEILDATKFG